MKRRERDNVAAQQPSGAEQVLAELLAGGVELNWPATVGGERFEVQMIAGHFSEAHMEDLREVMVANGGRVASDGLAAVMVVVPEGTGLITAPDDIGTDPDVHGAVLRVLQAEAEG